MNTGLLQIDGTLDLAQFWPHGNSDADTAKLLVTPGAGGFRFQAAPGQAFIHTDVFDGASVVGKSGKKSVFDPQGRITIRLQGIDAAELHYQPQSVLRDPPAKPIPGVKYRTKPQQKKFLAINEQYRQPFGETATVRLAAFLAGFGNPILNCRVQTAVEAPNDVFDTYGRMVGDVIIGQPAVNVNHWLVEQGLAFPAFYNSMSEGEIQAILLKARHARQKKLGLWQPGQYAAKIGQLNLKLIYRPAKKGQAGPAPDNDTVGQMTIFPKLFRRLVAWKINVLAGMVSGTFGQYLQSQKQDTFMYLADYLLQGNAAAPIHPLAEIVKGGAMQPQPEDIVIRENPSMLVPRTGRALTW